MVHLHSTVKFFALALYAAAGARAFYLPSDNSLSARDYDDFDSLVTRSVISGNDVTVLTARDLANLGVRAAEMGVSHVLVVRATPPPKGKGRDSRSRSPSPGPIPTTKAECKKKMDWLKAQIDKCKTNVKDFQKKSKAAKDKKEKEKWKKEAEDSKELMDGYQDEWDHYEKLMPTLP